MVYYTVYEITNLRNGKVYVGKHKTKKLDDDYFGSGTIIRLAIKKHGIKNFSKKILYCYKTSDEMDAKEKSIVNEEFCARRDTYNINVGGAGGFHHINTSRLNNSGHTKNSYRRQQVSDEELERRLKIMRQVDSNTYAGQLIGVNRSVVYRMRKRYADRLTSK